jgi:predicted RecA/RadA family phage recombinase
MHENYESTAQAVEYLAPYLTAQGYQIVSVGEMFKAKGIDMKYGEVYNKLP